MRNFKWPSFDRVWFMQQYPFNFCPPWKDIDNFCFEGQWKIGKAYGLRLIENMIKIFKIIKNQTNHIDKKIKVVFVRRIVHKILFWPNYLWFPPKVNFRTLFWIYANLLAFWASLHSFTRKDNSVVKIPLITLHSSQTKVYFLFLVGCSTSIY